MSARYRNFFFLVGVVATVIMLLSFDMPWNEVLVHVRRAGIWFPAVVVLWFFIYMMNAWSWTLIIKGQESIEQENQLSGQTNSESKSSCTRKLPSLGYWRVLKFTISGYALNSVTPVGLLGGEPYRIMELTPYIGGARAASSVILYAMMHIFSHFCFWLFSIVLFLVLYYSSLTWFTSLLLLLATAFCFLGVYFFLVGYRDGLAMRMLRLLSHLPFVGPRIAQWTHLHAQVLLQVDQQIADLHAQRRSTFYCSLLLEFAARLLTCLELQFILFIFTSDVRYWDCVLMHAFVSLFANLFFFIPMQMGTKEGGLAIVTDSMHMSGAYGVLTGLITRLREIVWIVIGLLLIRIDNNKEKKVSTD